MVEITHVRFNAPEGLNLGEIEKKIRPPAKSLIAVEMPAVLRRAFGAVRRRFVYEPPEGTISYPQPDGPGRTLRQLTATDNYDVIEVLSGILRKTLIETKPSMGTRLRTARKALGLSQRALADATGHVPSQTAQMEHGTNKLSADVVAWLSEQEQKLGL